MSFLYSQVINAKLLTMSVHQGERLKQLVEKLYKGNNFDFSKEVGIKNDTYLYKVYRKESLSAAMIKKVCDVLKIEASELFREDISAVGEPVIQYGNKDLEIKMLKSRVKNLEEMNAILKDQVELYKRIEGKKKIK